MDVAAGGAAAGRRRLVQLGHQGAHLGHAGRVGGAQDQRVAARLGNQGGLERGVGLAGRGRGCGAPVGAAAVDQARHQRCQVAGNRVLERNHLHIAGVGHIHGRHDARQALQVVGVVGDHQRVVAGVHVDGVVGADERAQHRHQIGRILEVELEDLRDDLPAAGRAARVALHHAHAAALQLGVGLGHHLVQAGCLHHREALQPQRGQELLERGGGRHGALGHQVELAFHARVHHHVAASDGGHGAGHGLDLGVGKVERDGFAGAHAAGAGVHRRLGANLTTGAGKYCAGCYGFESEAQAWSKQESHRFNPR